MLSLEIFGFCADQKQLQLLSYFRKLRGEDVLKQVVGIACVQLLRMKARLEFPRTVWDQNGPGLIVHMLLKHLAQFS